MWRRRKTIQIMRREVPQALQTVSEMMVYMGGASSDVD